MFATVNIAAMKIGVHVPFQTRVVGFFHIYNQEWNCWITW